MELQSTKGKGAAVTFREAVVRGLSPDGGLYLPLNLPRLSRSDLGAWRDLSFTDLSVELAVRLLGDEFPPPVVERLIREALDFGAPTRKVEPGRYVLELFHGPTLAFKDFGARFLARFFGHILSERGEHATILVATSGDTGGAVAHAFHGVEHVRVVVLYPAGKVSAFQESQMATLGGNVTAVRVAGDFDDCQRLVKQAFLDPGLAGLRPSSANSINVGRLVPQSFYYVGAYLSVAREGAAEVVFSVPSGNLGNLTAGVMAGRMGVPVRGFIAATNINRALDEYLQTGGYRPRPSLATISSAMDVGDPSNLPRLAGLHESIDALRARVSVVVIDDRATLDCIRRVYDRTGYVLDPHGAVGYAAADEYATRETALPPVVVLATAHPAKFGAVTADVLGFEPALPAGADHAWATRPLLAVDLDRAEYERFRLLLLGLPSVD